MARGTAEIRIGVLERGIPMVRMQIHLADDQAATLKCLAAGEGVSVAELVRRSID